jgi:ABC-type glycerol-3-phosphate transport system substrate-binding protein
LVPALLGVALLGALACSSNSNKNNNTSSTTNNAATQAAATNPPAATRAATASSGAAASATSVAASATSASAAGTAAVATGGNVAVPQSVVDADKALAAAAGSGSPVDSVTISKPVSIDFWHTQTGPNGDKINALIKDFQSKNPNITVNAQYVGNYDQLYQKIQTGITGGQTPDVAVAYENQVADYQTADKIVPLEDYVKSQKYGLPKDDYADILQGYRYDNFYAQYANKMLSFPFTKSIEMMYYNADKLKDAGVGVPQTWDDFQKALKAVTKGDTKAWAMGTDVDLFWQQIFSKGGKLITDDYKKWLFNSQQGQDSLKIWAQALQDGTAYQIAKQFADQTDFGAGKAVFTFSSSSGLSFYQQEVNNNGKFNWSVALPPHDAGQNPVTIMYGANVTVFKSTPEKQLAAWLFIKYFTSKDVNPDWSTSTGYLPIRTSGLNDDRVKAKIASLPAYAEAVKGQQYGQPGPPVRGVQAARDQVSQVLVAIFADPKQDVKKLLDNAVNEANAALTK